MSKYILFIFCVISFFSCNLIEKNEGNYKIDYHNDSLHIVKSIQTQPNGIVYYPFNEQNIKVFPDTQIEFYKDNTFSLKQGIILLENNTNKQNFWEKNSLHNLQIDKKMFFENIQGKAQFFRLKIPAELIFDAEVDITFYIQTQKPEDEIKNLKSKLHYLFKYNNYKYYGFFIPFGLYIKIYKYTIDIKLKSDGNLIGQIIENQSVQEKEYEKQVIYFRRVKSDELRAANVRKYREEKKKRDAICNENNPINYYFTGYNWPLNETKYITSEYGFLREWKLYNGRLYSRDIHTGVDFGQPTGTEIYTAGDGIVRYAEFGELIGNTVIIEHGMSLFTMYCHMSKILVKPGMVIKKGDVIGLVGYTGAATGPHLHWEARLTGMLVDPRVFFNLEDIYRP